VRDGGPAVSQSPDQHTAHQENKVYLQKAHLHYCYIITGCSVTVAYVQIKRSHKQIEWVLTFKHGNRRKIYITTKNMPCQPCEVHLLVRTHARTHRQEPFAGARSHACRKDNLEASGTVRITGVLDFVHRPVFEKLENTTTN
jgi:hypothetical protein